MANGLLAPVIGHEKPPLRAWGLPSRSKWESAWFILSIYGTKKRDDVTAKETTNLIVALTLMGYDFDLRRNGAYYIQLIQPSGSVAYEFESVLRTGMCKEEQIYFGIMDAGADVVQRLETFTRG
jgi:hypothetical protein